MILHITTGYRNYFVVNEQGHIGYPNGEFWGEDWVMLGLTHRRRNEFIRFSDLLAKLPEIDLKYKNGKFQWLVVDRDHGTRRIWQSPLITDLWIEEKNDGEANPKNRTK